MTEFELRSLSYNKRLLYIIYTLIIIGLILVFYLSWIPEPDVGKTGLMPEWLAEWADAKENDTLRTGVPFIFLGLFAGFSIILTRAQKMFWVFVWIGLTFTVVLAEAGQLLLEDRHFDWLDVFWGTLGAFLGLVLSTFYFFLPRLKLYLK